MAIVLENIDYKYQDNKVIEDLSLKIKSNIITTIVGKSGSGKTTLAEIISLLIKPSKGNIKLNESIGLVFQNPEEQFFSNTVEKEISFGLNYLNKDLSQIKKKVIDSLIMVNLDNSYLNRNLNTLSCGEKRKVAIASILATNPDIVILDEPTLGLDNKSQESLIKVLKLLKNRYNKTIIVFTKDLELSHIISDEVVVLDNGKIVLQGDKYQVFAKDISKYGLKKPKIIEFQEIVLKEKNIKLFNRDNLNDLMKDVYRSVK